jgi:hypothetical protein
MAVDMKRSTNMAPVSLSISYLTGSAWDGISMMTLISFGTIVAAGTRCRSMGTPLSGEWLGFEPAKRAR